MVSFAVFSWENYLEIEKQVFAGEMTLTEECCSDYFRFGGGVHSIFLGIVLQNPGCSST